MKQDLIRRSLIIAVSAVFIIVNWSFWPNSLFLNILLTILFGSLIVVELIYLVVKSEEAKYINIPVEYKKEVKEDNYNFDLKVEEPIYNTVNEEEVKVFFNEDGKFDFIGNSED